MSDLVKRLRSLPLSGRLASTIEAADEIERLTALQADLLEALTALSRPDGFASVSLAEEKRTRMAFAQRVVSKATP